MKLTLLLLPLSSVLFFSCTESQISQFSSNLVSAVGIPATTSVASTAKPNKIKLSRNGQVIPIRWSGATPYATDLYEDETTKGVKQSDGAFWFSPTQSKHYNIYINFTKKTYTLEQFDGAQLPTERGSITFL